MARAMRTVWRERPDARLVMTGLRAQPGDVAAIRAACGEEATAAACELPSYLSRADLLALYRRSSVLVAPLHDSAASQARVPSKVAEYLSAATPVVTSAVGDVGRLLAHGETALFATPDDPEDYARQILWLLENADAARAIGAAGREVARRVFAYGPATQPLADLVKDLAGRA